MDWPSALTVPATALLAVGVGAVAQWVQSELFERAVNVVRRRLRAEVYGEAEAALDEGTERLHRIVSERLAADVPAPEGDVEESRPTESGTESAGTVRTPVQSPADQRFTALLI